MSDGLRPIPGTDILAYSCPMPVYEVKLFKGQALTLCHFFRIIEQGFQINMATKEGDKPARAVTYIRVSTCQTKAEAIKTICEKSFAIGHLSEQRIFVLDVPSMPSDKPVNHLFECDLYIQDETRPYAGVTVAGRRDEQTLKRYHELLQKAHLEEKKAEVEEKEEVKAQKQATNKEGSRSCAIL